MFCAISAALSLSLDGPEHPESVQDPPSVVYAMKEVTFIHLDYDRLPVDIEASELHRVSPRIVSADIADEVAPVNERLLRNVEMPSNMVHGVSDSQESNIHTSFPSGNLILKKASFHTLVRCLQRNPSCEPCFKIKLGHTCH